MCHKCDTEALHHITADVTCSSREVVKLLCQECGPSKAIIIAEPLHLITSLAKAWEPLRPGSANGYVQGEGGGGGEGGSNNQLAIRDKTGILNSKPVSSVDSWRSLIIETPAMPH